MCDNASLSHRLARESHLRLGGGRRGCRVREELKKKKSHLNSTVLTVLRSSIQHADFY